MRSFVLLGRQALASDEFLLDDVPGTSGRLDVGLRCLRAALLISHGVRHDVVAYLVLGGGPRAPRTFRVRGAAVRFIRPDERSLAVLLRKTLATHADDDAAGFIEVRPGVAVARGGLDRVLEDVGHATPYALDESGPDVRDAAGLGSNDEDLVFFLGDPNGFEDADIARLKAVGAKPLSVGAVSVHAEDVIAILHNELDRRRHV